MRIMLFQTVLIQISFMFLYTAAISTTGTGLFTQRISSNVLENISTSFDSQRETIGGSNPFLISGLFITWPSDKNYLEKKN